MKNQTAPHSTTCLLPSATNGTPQSQPHVSAANQAPAWMTTILLWAALYNIAFGAFTVLFPNALFQFADMAPLNYPGVWQCVGMIVGVYGLGYGIAALAPYRHWPIVLVGLLGKIFGPIGFVYALIMGEFNLKFGSIIITNDLIWWIPFTLILSGAYQHWHQQKPQSLPLAQALKQYTTNGTTTLAQYTDQQPVLLIFLRHSGCTFCKQTLSQLHTFINKNPLPMSPVVVTMSSPEGNENLQQQYQLQSVPFISDPSRRLYQTFQLERGTLNQLFGLQVWLKGIQAALQGHGIGPLKGDGFQMAGTFVVYQQTILKAHRTNSAADSWIPDNNPQAFCTLPTP